MVNLLINNLQFLIDFVHDTIPIWGPVPQNPMLAPIPIPYRLTDEDVRGLLRRPASLFGPDSHLIKQYVIPGIIKFLTHPNLTPALVKL